MAIGETETPLRRHLSLEDIHSLLDLRRETREREREAEAQQAALRDTLTIIRLSDDKKPKLKGSSERVAVQKHANRQG